VKQKWIRSVSATRLLSNDSKATQEAALGRLLPLIRTCRWLCVGSDLGQMGVQSSAETYDIRRVHPSELIALSQDRGFW
jgi:hypothetical protein